ncbi:MAG: hypothetical protein AB1472_01705, partial [Candidatus Omnitrophota bacterium]
MFKKDFFITRFFILLLSFLLVFEQSGFAQVAQELNIAGYLTQLHTSIQDKFRPIHLRYLSYDNQNNNFRLLLDKGDYFKIRNAKSEILNKSKTQNLKPKTEELFLEEETKTLLEYFFIGISLSNDTFWVNLRPDSPNEIINDQLAQTQVGKILLEADLELKKDTSKLIDPSTPLGKLYWDKLYQKAEQIYGTQTVTIPTLVRPWIVPDEIIIRESADNAYIYKATLKVMLEQDYLKSTDNRAQSTDYSFKDPRQRQLNEYASQLLKELIIPKLTKDINSSKKYAPLRQVYYSLILAQWFKQRFSNKDGIYSRLINREDLTNLTLNQPLDTNTYFKAYQKSFKEGEYNLQTSIYTSQGQVIRSYISGGMNLTIAIPQPGQTIGNVTSIASTRAITSRKNVVEAEVKGERVEALKVVIVGEELEQAYDLDEATRRLEAAGLRRVDVDDIITELSSNKAEINLGEAVAAFVEVASSLKRIGMPDDLNGSILISFAKSNSPQKEAGRFLSANADRAFVELATLIRATGLSPELGGRIFANLARVSQPQETAQAFVELTRKLRQENVWPLLLYRILLYFSESASPLAEVREVLSEANFSRFMDFIKTFVMIRIDKDDSESLELDDFSNLSGWQRLKVANLADINCREEEAALRSLAKDLLQSKDFIVRALKDIYDVDLEAQELEVNVVKINKSGRYKDFTIVKVRAQGKEYVLGLLIGVFSANEVAQKKYLQKAGISPKTGVFVRASQVRATQAGATLTKKKGILVVEIVEGKILQDLLEESKSNFDFVFEKLIELFVELIKQKLSIIDLHLGNIAVDSKTQRPVVIDCLSPQTEYWGMSPLVVSIGYLIINLTKFDALEEVDINDQKIADSLVRKLFERIENVFRDNPKAYQDFLARERKIFSEYYQSFIRLGEGNPRERNLKQYFFESTLENLRERSPGLEVKEELVAAKINAAKIADLVTFGRRATPIPEDQLVTLLDRRIVGTQDIVVTRPRTEKDVAFATITGVREARGVAVIPKLLSGRIHGLYVREANGSRIIYVNREEIDAHLQDFAVYFNNQTPTREQVLKFLDGHETFHALV